MKTLEMGVKQTNVKEFRKSAILHHTAMGREKGMNLIYAHVIVKWNK